MAACYELATIYESFTSYVSSIVNKKRKDDNSPNEENSICLKEVNLRKLNSMNPVYEIYGSPKILRILECDPINLYVIMEDEDTLCKLNFTSLKWEFLKVCSVPSFVKLYPMIMSGKSLIALIRDPSIGCCNLYICNLDKKIKKFKSITTTGTKPGNKDFCYLFTNNHYLYAFTFSVRLDLYRLNLQTYEWEAVCVSSGEAYYRYLSYFHVAVIGSKLYLFGQKFNSGNPVPYSNIPVFNLKSKVWDVVVTKSDEEYGYPRPEMVSFIYNEENTVYLMIRTLNSHKQLTKWKFNTLTNSWKKCAYLIKIHLGLLTATSMSCGKIMSIVASSNEFSNFSSKYVNYDVLTSYINIPTLEQIAFDVLIHYRKMYNFTSKELKKIVPPDYRKEF